VDKEIRGKMKTISHEEWIKEAIKRYPDRNIAFVCPVCKHKQTVAEYKAAGAPAGAYGFSCIGRYLDDCRKAFGGPGAGEERPGPCDYTGGGLLRLNPINVIFTDSETGAQTEHAFFDFADDPLCP
jgi:hypothetical protein